MTKPSVAVVGLGAMGSRVALRLVASGYDVTVWNRSPGPAAAVAEHGAALAATPALAARDRDIMVTLVTDDTALDCVVAGPDGIAAGTTAGAIVVQSSTISPAGLRRLTGNLPPGVGLLDAPVLGSVAEAEAGTLRLLVGGDLDTCNRARPVLDTLGTVEHLGGLGQGTAAKLVANFALLSVVAALGEALLAADLLGLDSDAAQRVMSLTPLAEQAARRRPALEADEFPARFRLSLAHKDARLVHQAVADEGRQPRIAAAVAAWLALAESQGLGDLDHAAVLRTIRASEVAAHALPTPA